MPAISRPDQAPDATPTTAPIRRHKFSTPKLRLQLNDLAHEGSSVFLSNTKGNEDFEAQVQNVLNLLYTHSALRPSTRSVTFVLRAMSGVAYTTGSDLDDDHKEIHISLEYIRQLSLQPPRDEILGVVCHELVHCFQWNALGTCPGGLIEGIADWVRLRAGLGAKHWREDGKGRWDAGYQTTAFFLEYLEQRFGDGTVRGINESLRGRKYDGKRVFGDCCGGHEVNELWEGYQKQLRERGVAISEEGQESRASSNGDESSGDDSPHTTSEGDSSGA